MVTKADKKPTIDGQANDDCWRYAMWLPLEQRWTGTPFGYADFEGKYKLSWTEDALYVLVTISDDRKPSEPEKTDSLLFFLDTDNSGGNFTNGKNAFVIELLPSERIQTISKEGKRTNSNYPISYKYKEFNELDIWELEIPLQNNNGELIQLQNDQKIGFAIGYLDVDKGNTADNLIGSVVITEDHKEIIFENANYFGTLLLKN
ncbi:Carbohydrate family 9 binding domain-like [Pustulibacterium marinum]|uniref:Carbohydrate family 9 binding domain-like n=1 Tax=Pustulibacterium marinum TaxID=1224947 RepID=A0A1I7HLZ1_9FLAO|nr:CBM9 family sugar-binding protein [Pustulibacterium marinum]SFU61651.1 Carbohydrate family 9 binding domain-like [Pustulibacterium marinum]